MPTVPISEQRQLLSGQVQKPSETNLLMALAEMKSLGRLNELSTPSPSPNAKRSTNRRTTSPVR